jgi:hypothetical protein
LRARLAADGGRLWAGRLEEVPLLFVLDHRIFATANPEMTGFVSADGLFAGDLPKELIPANTSVKWAGRDWAMVLLPLPEEDPEALRLLIHEAWHVVQPTVLPLPAFHEDGAGSSLLDEPEGRLWLQLEWRALAASLTSGKAQSVAIRDALLFRQKRFSLATVHERRRETLLDLSEGLAEYTGWKLSDGTAPQLAAQILAEAPSRPSFVRSFPYFTGPAYALLLDQRRPGWIALLRKELDLQRLVAETLPEELRQIDGRRAGKVGRAYGLSELKVREQARWKTRQRQLAELHQRFVNGPTLRVRP